MKKINATETKKKPETIRKKLNLKINERLSKKQQTYTICTQLETTKKSQDNQEILQPKTTIRHVAGCRRDWMINACF